MENENYVEEKLDTINKQAMIEEWFNQGQKLLHFDLNKSYRITVFEDFGIKGHLI